MVLRIKFAEKCNFFQKLFGNSNYMRIFVPANKQNQTQSTMKTLKCKNTDKAVDLMMNADGFGRILAIATEGGEYWFTVGWYKTEAGARRQAAKQMAALGYSLDI